MGKKVKSTAQSEKERITYIYIVECEDRSLYTGITTDIARRMLEHYQRGDKGAKYTHSRRVSELKAVWEAKSYASAARLEYAIKALKRADKLLLIDHPQDVTAKYLPRLSGESYLFRKELCLPVIELTEQDKIIKTEGKI